MGKLKPAKYTFLERSPHSPSPLVPGVIVIMCSFPVLNRQYILEAVSSSRVLPAAPPCFSSDLQIIRFLCVNERYPHIVSLSILSMIPLHSFIFSSQMVELLPLQSNQEAAFPRSTGRQVLFNLQPQDFSRKSVKIA